MFRALVILVLVAGCSAPSLERAGVFGDPARVDDKALARAIDALDPAAMSFELRVVVQNDLWGLVDRSASARTKAIALEGVKKLAFAPARFVDDGWDLPAPLTGYLEVASELPSLQHERAYNDRRGFFVALKSERQVMATPQQRALFSRLLAVDSAGKKHLTPIVGEIEMLDFVDGELRRARVFKRDKKTRALVEVFAVRAIPGPGADRAVFELPEPVALDTLPCLACHDDDQMMSLPHFGLAPLWRRGRLEEGSVFLE